MRWHRPGPRGWLIVLTVVGLALLPTHAVTALGASLTGCNGAGGVAIAPQLVGMQQTLGATFGSPVSCAITDARGDVIQVMSTGLAIADPSGTALFASGDRHWALNQDGLQTWTANWHDGFYPPPHVTADQDESVTTAEPQLASVVAMTVVHVSDASNAVVVQDPDGSMFTVEPDGGCPDLVAAPGDHVFVRYSGSRTDLIFLQQHETCAVAAMAAAASD
jgi:hypothetical protein